MINSIIAENEIYMLQENVHIEIVITCYEVGTSKNMGGGGGAIAPSAPMLPMPICNYSIY